jgi:TRAP-type C4-dicarboxylate transport system permease small subunit
LTVFLPNTAAKTLEIMVIASGMTRYHKWQKRVHGVESTVLVTLLAGMICLSTAQILLRNVFEGGFIWGESLVRVLVLWLGLFGSMVAARQGKHINIDVVTRFLPDRFKNAAHGLTALFTTTVCLILVHVSLTVVSMEYQLGQTAFGGLPTWVLTTIIPFGFAVIALRYFLAALFHFRNVIRPDR